jgi:hypothetical protein
MYEDSMKTLSEIMEHMKERGFTNDFQIKDNEVISRDTNENFSLRT